MPTLDALLALDDRWNAAYHHGDPSALEGILAADWLGFLPDGTSIGRADLITHFPTDPAPTLMIERHAARIHGDTGITRLTLYEGPHRIQSVLRVYAQVDGHWQAISAQVVP